MARTAYKSNNSTYTINGRSSNYKEVTTLLKGRGIDLDHKRFLILQVCISKDLADHVFKPK